MNDMIRERPTPITDILLATDEAVKRYQGVPAKSLAGDKYATMMPPWFNRMVDHVRHTEMSGGDPIAALRDTFLLLDEALALRQAVEMKRAMLEIRPTLIVDRPPSPLIECPACGFQIPRGGG